MHHTFRTVIAKNLMPLFIFNCYFFVERLLRKELKNLIREKSAIRKQIAFAMERQDYDTAQYYMNSICKREKNPTQRKWLKEEEEYLMHHVDALGLHKACEVVSRKLERNREAVRAKYYALVRKEKKA